VNNRRLNRQLRHIGRVLAIKLSAQDLGKITQLISGFPKDWTISSPRWGAGRWTGFTRQGRVAPSGLCTFRSRLIGFAQDYPRLYVWASLNSPSYSPHRYRCGRQ
jgi:hypothetical protein